MKAFAIGFSALVTGLIGILFLLPGPAGDVDVDGSDTAIEHVRLFDGERVIEHATVLMQGGRVVAVGRDIDVPDDALRIDGRGKTLLPGLIDAHVHAYGNARSDALRMGATTLIDLFSAPAQLPMMREQRASLAPTSQSDVFSAGYLATAEGGHGTQYGIPVPIPESPEAADQWVADRLEEGSDFIKIIIEDGSTWQQPLPTLGRDRVEALIEAAHARDVMAVAHASTQASARMAVEAGIDGLVHVFADEPVSEAFIELAKDAGIWVTPTAAVLAGVHGQPVPDWLLDSDPDAERINGAQRSMMARRFPGSESRKAGWSTALENIRRLHEAGIPILAGSDAGNPGTAHGPSIHHEMKLLVDAGLTPAEALAAATRLPAEAFSLDGRGCLRHGCRADAVLVAGNPLEDIRATARIQQVWKNGHAQEPSTPESTPPPAANASTAEQTPAADASRAEQASATGDARLDAMSRLDHWAGVWEGSGWSRSGPGAAEDFRITETVTSMLEGRVLLVEGLGSSDEPDGETRVTHHALGLVSYDPGAGRYNFQTHTASGVAHDAELVVADDGVMRWGFQDERSGVQLRFDIRVEGDTWHETGEVSPDGGANWYPILDMTLQRQTSETE